MHKVREIFIYFFLSNKKKILNSNDTQHKKEMDEDSVDEKLNGEQSNGEQSNGEELNGKETNKGELNDENLNECQKLWDMIKEQQRILNKECPVWIHDASKELMLVANKWSAELAIVIKEAPWAYGTIKDYLLKDGQRWSGGTQPWEADINEILVFARLPHNMRSGLLSTVKRELCKILTIDKIDLILTFILCRAVGRKENKDNVEFLNRLDNIYKYRNSQQPLNIEYITREVIELYFDEEMDGISFYSRMLDVKQDLNEGGTTRRSQLCGSTVRYLFDSIEELKSEDDHLDNIIGN